MTGHKLKHPFDDDFAAARKRACREVADTSIGHCNGTPITLSGFLAMHDNSPETTKQVVHNIAATYDREMLTEWQCRFAPVPLKESLWDRRPWLRSRRDKIAFLSLWVLSAIGAVWLAVHTIIPLLNWIIRSLT